jgi:hypothetical protein
MRSRILWRWLPALVLAASVATIAGCTHPSYYDSVYADTHRWDSREEAAYRRWEAERQIQHIESGRGATRSSVNSGAGGTTILTDRRMSRKEIAQRDIEEGNI